jgi:hypothetical protein
MTGALSPPMSRASSAADSAADNVRDMRGISMVVIRNAGTMSGRYRVGVLGDS